MKETKTQQIQARQIYELTERLASVQNERDNLRAIIGQQARFVARVLAEAELLKSQLQYFDARKEVDVSNGEIYLTATRD